MRVSAAADITSNELTRGEGDYVRIGVIMVWPVSLAWSDTGSNHIASFTQIAYNLMRLAQL